MSGKSRGTKRIWKTTLLLLLACLTAAWAGIGAAPAAAKKNVAGRLDPSFGKAGKATVAFPAESSGSVGVKYEIPFQFTPGHVQMAPAPDGKIVVAGSTQLVRLLPDGKLDPSFGSGGVVTIERPAGQSFVLADVAVDSQDRVLIAGSVRPQPSESTPDPLISSAMVRRYAADGSVDPSFGDQGTVIASFGIEPPLIGSTRYKAPSVGLRSMVVDAQNRPVLTGASVSEIANCFSNERAVSTGFVARLSESGAPDPSFGNDGLRQIADLGSFAQAHLFPSGELFTVGSPRNGCSEGGSPRVVLTDFDAAGNLAPGFGFSGFHSVGLQSAPVANLAPSGKILLLGPARRSKHESQQLVMRLLGDGAVDPSFGRIGRITLVGPKPASFDAIAADRRERVLLAGRASRALPSGNGPRRATFLLGRLKPKGRFDRSFGRRGTVRTGFGGPTSSYATQVLVDGRNRILVGGPISSPRLATGGGFAIARYLGGR